MPTNIAVCLQAFRATGIPLAKFAKQFVSYKYCEQYQEKTQKEKEKIIVMSDRREVRNEKDKARAWLAHSRRGDAF